MDTAVAIIGGGPCGLLSSLLLARQGVPNVVLEKHPDISFHPKAMGVTRRTAEIYRQLGLLEEMREASLPADVDSVQIWLKSLAGEELGRSPVLEPADEPTPCPRFHCPQTHTESVLRAAVDAEPRSDLRFKARVTAFEETAAGVEIAYEDRETGRSHTLRARWLVAADGAASPVREQLGIATHGPGDRGHFLNVHFRADYGPHLTGRRSILYSLLDEAFYELFVSVNGRDRWLMHHFLQPGETAEDYTEDGLREIVRTASGLPDVPVEVLGVSPWVMSPKVAAQWRAGRVFLTGDAAARLSPAGGLGLNTGLQSAANLAWKLAAVEHGQAGDGLLDTYGRERLGAVKTIFGASEGNADEIFAIVGAATSGDWETARAKIADSRRSGSGLGLDLGLAYDAGALVPDGTDAPAPADPANDYVPTARPGHRAPHLAIRGDSGETSTLDLFGHGFVLVTGTDGAVWTAAADAVADRSADGPPLRAAAPGGAFAVDADALHAAYGITPTGAVLVRPDGYVAARWTQGDGQEADSLDRALATVLARA